jgi:thioredoxin-related protein
LHLKLLLMHQRIILLLLLFIGLSSTWHIAISQANDSLPPYKQFPFIPSFQLIKADSSKFYMKDAIPKKMAAVVIIFSPTCSHCQHQAQEITSHMQQLANVHFVFATGYPITEMKQFISDYGLDKFKNIQVGHYKGMNLGSFYKVNNLPGIFVYNKKGKLVEEYATNITAAALTEAVKK